MKADKDIKKYFKHTHKDTFPRQHVSKESSKVEESMLSMVQEKEYSEYELESINHELRQFDLNLKYGPVSGLSRTQRWQRAYDLYLNPPLEIKAYLEDTQLRLQMPNVDKHLWSGIIDIDLDKTPVVF